MRVGIVLVIVFLIVVFLVSFFRPWRSRRLQEWVKEHTATIAGRLRRDDGTGREAAAESVEKGSRATQEVAHAGRAAHDKAFDSSSGEKQEEKLESEYGDEAEHGREDDERADPD